MKYLRILFATLFILLIVTPILLFNWKGKISEREKRNLAEFPRLSSNNKLNSKIFSECDEYLKDRFGMRSEAVDLANIINHDILRDISNDRVLIGKNNWLFYISGDNFNDFMKNNLFNQNDLEKINKQFTERLAWCEKNNIKCIVLIPPNKHNVYPEFYPFDRPAGMTRTGQLITYMKNEGSPVDVIYPLDLLLSKKKDYAYPLYYEMDTHWNQTAAYNVSKVIEERMRQMFPQMTFPDYEYDVSVSTTAGGGDLTPMLGFLSFGKITGVSYKPHNAEWSDIYAYKKNEGTNGVIIENQNKKLPHAIVFRDSFFIALEPFVSSLCSTADYRWKIFEEDDKTQILANKPDLIIWEIVERNTPLILGAKWNDQ